MRRLLFIAYHFPPMQGSSGIQRTLSFARHLPAKGWRPHVLTATLGAYERISRDSNRLVPEGTPVSRALSFDTKRHLALLGRYPDVLAVPDRWQSWAVAGILKGAWLVRRHGLEVVASTYPIASAHVIGCGVSRITGRPWVVDLRDPMLQKDFPPGRLRRRSFGWIERLAFRHAARVVVTTPGCAGFYRERYGETAARKIVVIPNGYDETQFPVEPGPPGPVGSGELKILHSGVVYGNDRNPEKFLRALNAVLGPAPGNRRVRVVFRAPGSELALEELAAACGAGDLVEVAPPIPYGEALDEMLASGALALFQANTCNRQIPAKVYEYVYTRRPILGVTDPVGDTGRLLASVGIDSVAALEDQGAIEAMLRDTLPRIRAGTVPMPSETAVAALSRRVRAAEFANVLEEVSDG